MKEEYTAMKRKQTDSNRILRWSHSSCGWLQNGSQSGEGTYDDEQVGDGEAENAFGPNLVGFAWFSLVLVTVPFLPTNARPQVNVFTGDRMSWKNWRRSWDRFRTVISDEVGWRCSWFAWEHDSRSKRWDQSSHPVKRTLGAPHPRAGRRYSGHGRSERYRQWWRHCALYWRRKHI